MRENSLLRTDVAALGTPIASRESYSGSKAANLSRLAEHFDVPAGVVLTRNAFDSSGPTMDAVAEVYRLQTGGEFRYPVAVRSSAVGEDGVDNSFAGVHDTVLGVNKDGALVDALLTVFDSFSAQRSQEYRAERKASIYPAILVQEMVQPKAAGVLFTQHPAVGGNTFVINAAHGLGESVVSGAVTPDEILIDMDAGTRSYELGSKETRLDWDAEHYGVRRTPNELAEQEALTEDEVTDIAVMAIELRSLLGYEVDMEWAIDYDGHLVLLQARPVTI